MSKTGGESGVQVVGRFGVGYGPYEGFFQMSPAPEGFWAWVELNQAESGWLLSNRGYKLTPTITSAAGGSDVVHMVRTWTSGADLQQIATDLIDDNLALDVPVDQITISTWHWS